MAIRDEGREQPPGRIGRPPVGSLTLARALVRHAERAMVRASDAVLIRGNTARVLPDSPVAFSTWIESIERAKEWVHLENYIIRNDRIGRLFRELLADKAQEGVRVRLLYDWVGCWATPKSFWKPFRAAGVDVRAFSPPRVTEPLKILRRDHRKVVVVDGSYASVAGMCIGDEWAGESKGGAPAWRDTGVEIIGPAAAVVDRAFARTWRETGEMLPLEEIPDPQAVPRVGDVSIRVVEGEPGRSRIYRLSQFVAVGVEQRLWITDPYFVAPPAMTEALAAAARDGVDVRILVPAYNNWPLIGGFSRAGYRPLLEAGVRIFEWEGPMIHAKTAVADGVWSRVGSSNLNLASLMSNWELDITILDRGVGAQMEDLFMRDLSSSVEIELPSRYAGVSTRRTLVRHPVEEIAGAANLAAAREARRRAKRGSRVGRMLSQIARASIVLARALLGQRNVALEDRGWIVAIAMLVL
ncbi:MAG TPA: phospholipase D-like domain-containing protein, partial [Longimicrobiaceae bacterium]|nr:phospholipase D-like domain-containing protein [Longimicrobiaceae bacterium]